MVVINGLGLGKNFKLTEHSAFQSLFFPPVTVLYLTCVQRRVEGRNDCLCFSHGVALLSNVPV